MSKNNEELERLLQQIRKLVRRSKIEHQYQACGIVNDGSYKNSRLLVNLRLNKMIAMKEIKFERERFNEVPEYVAHLNDLVSRGCGYFIALLDYSIRMVNGMNY